MFIIELTYTAPLAEIDHHLEAHKSFLEKYYASENFIMSGRKDPRNGGIILAQAPSRGEIEGSFRKIRSACMAWRSIPLQNLFLP